MNWTALRFAAAFGRVDAGRVLVNAKADVNSVDFEVI